MQDILHTQREVSKQKKRRSAGRLTASIFGTAVTRSGRLRKPIPYSFRPPLLLVRVVQDPFKTNSTQFHRNHITQRLPASPRLSRGQGIRDALAVASRPCAHTHLNHGRGSEYRKRPRVVVTQAQAVYPQALPPSYVRPGRSLWVGAGHAR